MSASSIPEKVPEENSSFLRGCLVEGDSVQEARLRRSKRRALLISIAAQFLIIASLVLFPLFSKGENIANRVIVLPPIPFPKGAPANPRTPSQPTHGRPEVCRFCDPPAIPTQIEMSDPTPSGDPAGLTDDMPIGSPDGIDVSDLLPTNNASHPPQPPATPRPKERLHVNEPVLNAMLIRRIKPIYPALAVQIRREGRVELHAIIATDGTVQSLEVMTGDPLFIQSALTAVREWRYRPTILDGQPIEVDTHITVIYTLAH